MARDGELDVHFGVSTGGYAGRLDVVAGPTGRRLRSEEAKARIAAESLMPGVRVADVARRHGTTRWQVYDWRRRLRDGRLALPEDLARDLAEKLAGSLSGKQAIAPMFAALVVEEAGGRQAAGSTIEIVMEDVVIRAPSGAEDRHLSQVIRAVRAAL